VAANEEAKKLALAWRGVKYLGGAARNKRRKRRKRRLSAAAWRWHGEMAYQRNGGVMAYL